MNFKFAMSIIYPIFLQGHQPLKIIFKTDNFMHVCLVKTMSYY